MRVRTLMLLTIALLAGCADNPKEETANIRSTPSKSSAIASMTTNVKGAKMSEDKVGSIEKTDEDWRKSLTPEQFHILREKGTERAFTGKFWNNHDSGMYTCAACGLELFSSDTKFES